MKIMLSLAILLGICFVSVPSLAFETLAREAIIVDHDSAEVLFEKNSAEKMPPSSMSKLMTAYLVFERLKEGSLQLSDKFTVSEKAWAMQGSKMFVAIGSQVAVEELLQGMIVQSGNDACIVLAEGVAGSEEEFANLMNKKAAELGLKNSHFVNATGWPDENHYMTAEDLSILARALINNFPEYYHFYSQRDFTYNNIKQGNRNVLLDRGIGVDGLKTGHTEIAGYGITISAKQGERRLVVVVNGLSSMKERADEAEKLLKWAMMNFENKTIASKAESFMEVPVWMGKEEKVPVGLSSDLKVTMPRQKAGDIKMKALFAAPLAAPVKKGDKVGELVVTLPDGRETRKELVALDEINEKTGFSRFSANLKYKLAPYKPEL